MGDFSKDIQSTFANEWIKAVLNITYTANHLKQIGEKQFAPYGISPQQYNVLRILRGAKTAITVNTVKSRMVEKTPNTTRLMDKLCSKSLIERSRSETDRRTVYVKITPEGLDLLNQISIPNNQLDFSKTITEAEAKTLNDILDKLRP